MTFFPFSVGEKSKYQLKGSALALINSQWASEHNTFKVHGDYTLHWETQFGK